VHGRHINRLFSRPVNLQVSLLLIRHVNPQSNRPVNLPVSQLLIRHANPQTSRPVNLLVSRRENLVLTQLLSLQADLHINLPVVPPRDRPVNQLLSHRRGPQVVRQACQQLSRHAVRLANRHVALLLALRLRRQMSPPVSLRLSQLVSQLANHQVNLLLAQQASQAAYRLAYRRVIRRMNHLLNLLLTQPRLLQVSPAHGQRVSRQHNQRRSHHPNQVHHRAHPQVNVRPRSPLPSLAESLLRSRRGPQLYSLPPSRVGNRLEGRVVIPARLLHLVPVGDLLDSRLESQHMYLRHRLLVSQQVCRAKDLPPLPAHSQQRSRHRDHREHQVLIRQRILRDSQRGARPHNPARDLRGNLPANLVRVLRLNPAADPVNAPLPNHQCIPVANPRSSLPANQRHLQWR
jgi:hypothetical protein